MRNSTLVDTEALERLRSSVDVLYRLVDGLEGQACIDDETRDQMRKQAKFIFKQMGSLVRATKPEDGEIISILDDQFEVKRV